MFRWARTTIEASRRSLTVATMATAAALVAACGAGSSTALSVASSSSAVRTSSSSSSATVQSTTAQRSVGPAVSGGGATILLPRGWHNAAAVSGAVSSYLNSAGVGQGGGDSLIIAAGPKVDGVVRTLNVRSMPYVPDVTLLESTWSSVRDGLEKSAVKASNVSDLTTITLAGETAEQFTANEAPAGLHPVAVTQLFVSHAGSSYAVTFSYSRNDPGAAADVQAMLSGWSWE